MNVSKLLMSLTALSLSYVSAAEEKTYVADWQSLKQHQNPRWLADEKYGIFIHWGPNSVPAFNDEWYARWMYRPGHEVFEHHKEKYGDQKTAGYIDFIPQFTASKWDPKRWAKLFKEVGARYVIPTAEHHDHFALWDSKYTQWDAKEKGPKRDIIGELAEAVRAEGMRFGVSNHRARGWNFFTYDEKFDTLDPEHKDFYWPQLGREPDHNWLTDWQLKLHELVDKYQPDLMWFDYGWASPAFEPYKKDYVTYYYNEAEKWNKQVGVIYKGDQLPRGAGILDVERGKLDELWPEVWMTDTSIFTKTWGYVEGEDTKKAYELIHDFIDIISKNGVLLLNIVPKADGTIPQNQVSLLKEIGAWITSHGEAIYKTRPFDVYGEGDDIRFTRKGNKIYVFFTQKPEGEIKLEELSSEKLNGFKIESLKSLKTGQTFKFEHKKDGLVFAAPANWPGKHAWVAEVELSGLGFSRPKVNVEFRPEGGAVFAKGKVYNFTDQEEIVDVKFYHNRRMLAAVSRVKLKPGESSDVRYEHRDQNHYGARSALISNMEEGVHSFRFGAKRPSSGETLMAFPSISTQGIWKFMEGDDANWAQSDFDDSEWKDSHVHGEWPLRRVKGKTGWYRKSFDVPSNWKGNELYFNLGVVMGDYTIYVNGEKYVDHKQQDVEFHFSHEIEKFSIPASKVNFGGKNTISIRLHCHSRAGLVGPAGFIGIK